MLDENDRFPLWGRKLEKASGDVPFVDKTAPTDRDTPRNPEALLPSSKGHFQESKDERTNGL
jgi:hypothetical protein